MAALASLALVGGAVALLGWANSSTRPASDGVAEPMVVYCAAGIRPAVEPIVAAYEREFGIPCDLQFGPSGGLETQLQLSGRGDLYLPAATSPFLDRLRTEGVVREVMPIATLRLVIAYSENVDDPPASVAELLARGSPFGICNVEAAAGQRTKASLQQSEVWDAVRAASTVSLPTVTELAEAVRDGSRLQAGVVWETTAKQFGLRSVAATELAASESTVAVGVLDSASDPTAALRLARYLSSQDKGQPSFAEQHFVCVPSDSWAETPRLELFSGTVNRNAIAPSLKEFQEREGVEITTVFDGCGTLVGAMKTGASPDAYFACDVSYVEQVSERFGTPLEVSENRIVLLTKKGNPKSVTKLEDLVREDVFTGLCDPDLTALGALTRRLLRETGHYDQVIETGARTQTTGDLLVTQLLAGDKLDVAVVYEANCIKALDQLEMVVVDHPLARAVQPFSILRESAHPRLAERLRDYLVTAQSRERFEDWGFQWRAGTPQ